MEINENGKSVNEILGIEPDRTKFLYTAIRACMFIAIVENEDDINGKGYFDSLKTVKKISKYIEKPEEGFLVGVEFYNLNEKLKERGIEGYVEAISPYYTVGMTEEDLINATIHLSSL